MTAYTPPSSILIIGTGVFSLSTALALLKRPEYKNTTITLLDRSPFPAPDASSVDSSRIIRADYGDPLYAELADSAQKQWRQTGDDELGGQGRYSESGLCLTCDTSYENTGQGYVRSSFSNVQQLMKQAGDTDGVLELPSAEAIQKLFNVGPGSGEWGYINRRSGWADAGASLVWLRKEVEKLADERVKFIVSEVTSLIFSPDQSTILGANTASGTQYFADLTILAAGAWSAKFLDLRSQVHSSGQCLLYIDITDEEQERYKDIPVLLNMATGYFILPPRNNILKIARHAHGYSNPTMIPHPDPSSSGEMISVSLPQTTYDHPDNCVPVSFQKEAAIALHRFLPDLPPRPFSHTRVCWYTDTPAGEFLITYCDKPQSSGGLGLKGVFLATGGSGHGFKFLPVLGEKIVDVMEGKDEVWEKKWGWKITEGWDGMTDDGSRAGPRGEKLCK
ncbi:hypothetical protein BOTNAR_0060g00290 [Botryotinia narcissicola]|uniref:FAD dependent oxidoreductase domain-containing protein n=1 Tax=Botryotinia narcissicola TaxID=278944 RepID=A0A4Z1IYK6_9HELO|nr:hypothetical protein BOTNAR_0060g00290 [Botryotinia narcissicola]